MSSCLEIRGQSGAAVEALVARAALAGLKVRQDRLHGPHQRRLMIAKTEALKVSLGTLVAMTRKILLARRCDSGQRFLT